MDSHSIIDQTNNDRPHLINRTANKPQQQPEQLIKNHNRNKTIINLNSSSSINKYLVLVLWFVFTDIIVTRSYYHYRIQSEIIDYVQHFKSNHNINQANVLIKQGQQSNPKSPLYLICNTAETMVHKRQQIIVDARSIGYFGNKLAQIFDQARHTNQTEKVQKIKNTKTCKQILDSCGRSNSEVNWVVRLSWAIWMVLSYMLLKQCY